MVPLLQTWDGVIVPAMSGAFGAVRQRDFRIYLVGFSVSLLGVWMQRVAMSWYVVQLTNSAFWVGAVEAIGAAPTLLFTMHAGALADRVSKVRLMVLTQSIAAAGAWLLAALLLADRVLLWHLIVVAAVVGSANAFGLPARQAFITQLVGRDNITSAIALNSSAFNASRMVGPAIAGVLVAAAGVAACFVVNGLTYIVFILALLLMSADRPPADSRPVRSAQAIKEGWRYVMHAPRARYLIANIAIVSVFGLPVLVLMPVVARDVLGGGAVEYGWLMSAVGVGAAVGALLIAAVGHRIDRGAVLVRAALFQGTVIFLFAFQRSYVGAFVLLVALGFGMTVVSALTNTILQSEAPDELRGRVISFYAFAFLGLSPLGSFGAGVVAGTFGTTLAIASGGVVTLSGAVALARSRVFARSVQPR